MLNYKILLVIFGLKFKDSDNKPLCYEYLAEPYTLSGSRPINQKCEAKYKISSVDWNYKPCPVLDEKSGEINQMTTRERYGGNKDICRQMNDRHFKRHETFMQSFTVSGRKCASWSKTFGIKHNFSSIDFGMDIEDAHDYCLNPDDSQCGPWCFLETEHTKADVVREPCFKICYSDQFSPKTYPCRREKYTDIILGSPDVDSDLMYKIAGKTCGINYLPSDFHIKGKQTEPFTKEFYPFSARRLSKCPWGYTCVSGPADNVTVEPVYVRCRDLKRICIDAKTELDFLCYEYLGHKSTSLDGRTCLRWHDLQMQQRHPRDTINSFTLTANQREFLKFALDKCDFGAYSTNNRCTNLVLSSEAELDSKWFNIEEFALGPMCFVREKNRKVSAQPCFPTCTDMTIEKLGCAQKTPGHITIRKMENIKGNPCIEWKFDNVWVRLKSVLPSKSDDLSCGYAAGAENAMGPVCAVKDPSNVYNLEPCYPACDESLQNVTFDQPWSFHPCSHPDLAACCRASPDFQSGEPSFNKWKPDINIYMKPVVEATPTPKLDGTGPSSDLGAAEDPTGTFVEPGLRGPEILLILLAILYLLGVGIIVRFWSKMYKEDWQRYYGNSAL